MTRRRANPHECDGAPNACIEPHGEHECGRGLGSNGQHLYLPIDIHRCACGFTWNVVTP